MPPYALFGLPREVKREGEIRQTPSYTTKKIRRRARGNEGDVTKDMRENHAMRDAHREKRGNSIAHRCGDQTDEVGERIIPWDTLLPSPPFLDLSPLASQKNSGDNMPLHGYLDILVGC